jgi:phosphonate transport system substrate-binding protein
MPEAPATHTKRIEGGFDANLDFPFDDAGWTTFARATACSITSYTDLDVLTTALRQRLFEFSYLPSSNCFFLRDAPYRGIVSAMTPITKRAAQSSVFVVAKENPATSWHDLRGKRLGYINTYCTTSYFSPSVLLGREGLALKDFFNAFPVAAWQGQIDAVLSGGIDATMVYEDVWLAQPSNAARTKILARLDDLPTPPFIVRTNMDETVVGQLKQTLLGLTTDGKGAL